MQMVDMLRCSLQQHQVFFTAKYIRQPHTTRSHSYKHAEVHPPTSWYVDDQPVQPLPVGRMIRGWSIRVNHDQGKQFCVPVMRGQVGTNLNLRLVSSLQISNIAIFS